MSKFVLVSCHNEAYASLAKITLNENKKMLLSQWATEFGAKTYEIIDKTSLRESYICLQKC